MNSIDKIEELFKQLSDNSNKLSVILPQLYPIALECKDFVGFRLLYFWGTPMHAYMEADKSYIKISKQMMCSAGISEEDAEKIEAIASGQYLSMRAINENNDPQAPIKIWSARELEDFFKRCDDQVAELKVPEGLHQIAAYQKGQEIKRQKLSIRSDKTRAEKQYAILHSLISSKLAEYKTKLSQEKNEEDAKNKNEIVEKSKIETMKENNMNNYEKLRKLYDEIDNLIAKKATASLPEFTKWKKKLELLLLEQYGKESQQYKNFISLEFQPSYPNTSQQDYIDVCGQGLKKTKDELATYLDDMTKKMTKLEINTPQEKGKISMEKETKERKKVFIVHGHSKKKLSELKDILENKFGLKPIILSKEPDKGNTIIEKFEKTASTCEYAFALFTPDDIVIKGSKKYFQARPNVIFELGWFYAKLGRDHVCVLEKESKKSSIFSDLQGILRIQFKKDISEKFEEIERELKSAKII